MNVHLKNSQDDMKNYKRILVDFSVDESAVKGCCFFMQQALEKILKAFLLRNNTPTKERHNIERIIEEAEAIGVVVPDMLKMLAAVVTSWSVATRYGEAVYTNRETLKVLEGIYNDLLLQFNGYGVSPDPDVPED